MQKNWFYYTLTQQLCQKFQLCVSKTEMDFRQIYFLLFLCLQDQMEELTKQTQTRNDKMQLMMEQIVLSNKSSQKEKTDRQKE